MKTPLVPWTRAGNTDAVNNAPCPHCKATPGQLCRLPSGRRYFDVHSERIQELHRLYPQYHQQKINSVGVSRLAGVLRDLGLEPGKDFRKQMNSKPRFKVGDKVQADKSKRSDIEADLESDYREHDITSRKYDRLLRYLRTGKPFIITGIEKEMTGPVETRRDMYILGTDTGLDFYGIHEEEDLELVKTP